MTWKQPKQKVVKGRKAAANKLRKLHAQRRVVVAIDVGRKWMSKTAPKARRALLVRTQADIDAGA